MLAAGLACRDEDRGGHSFLFALPDSLLEIMIAGWPERVWGVLALKETVWTLSIISIIMIMSIMLVGATGGNDGYRGECGPVSSEPGRDA